MQRVARLARSPLAPAVTAMVLLFVAWELAVASGLLNPFVVPAPSAMVAEGGRLASDPLFGRSVWLTTLEAVLGFAIGTAAGFAIGAATVMSPWFRSSVMPLVVVIQNIPRIAIVPLLLIWFGFGLESKVAMAAVACFFPVAINTVLGLDAAEQDQRDVFRSLGASPWQRFRLLEFKAALPYILAGLKTAAALALTAAVVAEYVSSSAGLGFMIKQAGFQLNVARVFLILGTLATIGAGMYLFLHLVERRLVHWRA